ncbi:hypothetical protein, partial [Mesorhizobium sp. M7A.F.Ca.US.001.04.1.1]|uniref:hypothetical protein n=1 Tax=Mesorhizobium sp. M7A.F.Ca.US.001.04.1.1 TaxID=2496726 RepID=UPI0019D24D64
IRPDPRRIARHAASPPSLVFFAADPVKPLALRHFPIRVSLCQVRERALMLHCTICIAAMQP